MWFPVAHEDSRLPAKSTVIGLELDGRFKAYPIERFPEVRGRLRDRFAGQDLILEYDRNNLTGRVLDAHGAEIPTFTAFWFAWSAFHPDTAVFGMSPD